MGLLNPCQHLSGSILLKEYVLAQRYRHIDPLANGNLASVRTFGLLFFPVCHITAPIITWTDRSLVEPAKALRPAFEFSDPVKHL